LADLVSSLPRPRGFGETTRSDTWWVKPLAVFLAFSAFIVYSTWAGLQGEFYTFGPYLSPFYSPEIFGTSEHALFGPFPAWWPAFLPASPALLILWAPVSFRLTCYYYRGAYYKSFWADPVGCAVGEPRKGYRGERLLPLVIQNIHRYFLIFAFALIAFLTYDVWRALWFEAPGGGVEFGVGVGTLVLLANVSLLSLYTFGCHSLRHLVGGRLTKISNRPVQSFSYKRVSSLNRRHGMWAWFSLVWVGFTDIYIRLCAMGIWTDVRLF
jgi:hypothetical protein